ncbi:MAG: hypothetical protein FWD42_06210 [Solirubrobacterales bacterium]|nr:hypothetical protein [Solirubrobacterales bacterium]
MSRRVRSWAGATALSVALAGVLASALLAGALLCPRAHASFGPIQIQSLDGLEQAGSASEPAISGDGRYLAFVASFGGNDGVVVTGVYRKDLQTGQVQLVVAGGSAPSISRDGRYVSFTDATALVSAAKPGSNVYVRDMALDPAYEGPCTQSQEAAGECPYELASALNGSGEGLTYSGAGAVASGRVALSASGREIAFSIQGASNLTSEPSGSTPGTPTPAGQIAVRYLDRRETVLVSAERAQGSGEMTDRPVAAGAFITPGAALSGDGSTVAWVGAHIPAQAPTLEGERQQIESDDSRPSNQDEAYDEPLWRRIGEGSAAPTRRMVGGGDPLAPGCPPGGTIAIPACQGPYPGLPWEGTRGGDETNYGWAGSPGSGNLPALSYDGWSTVLIGDPDSTANVFAVDMHEGLGRREALRELTPEVPVPGVINPGVEAGHVATAGGIGEAAISPDGTRIAFITQRQQFPLAPLIYAEEPPGELGIVELYEIVDQESLQRITHGPGDGPTLEAGNPAIVTGNGASAPSYTDDDRTVAFADTGTNLIYGEVGARDSVYTATEPGAPDVPGTVTIGAAPPGRQPASQWRLSAVAVTHPDGSATLDVVVPGAGRLAASATATVPVAARRGAKGAVEARASRHSARRPGSRRPRRAAGRVTPTALQSRTVATAQLPTQLPGLCEVPLRVSAPYGSLLRARAGIYAAVRVQFTGAGGPPLAQTLFVSLHQAPQPKRGAPKRGTKQGAVKPSHSRRAANPRPAAKSKPADRSRRAGHG